MTRSSLPLLVVVALLSSYCIDMASARTSTHSVKTGKSFDKSFGKVATVTPNGDHTSTVIFMHGLGVSEYAQCAVGLAKQILHTGLMRWLEQRSAADLSTCSAEHKVRVTFSW